MSRSPAGGAAPGTGRDRRRDGSGGDAVSGGCSPARSCCRCRHHYYRDCRPVARSPCRSRDWYSPRRRICPGSTAERWCSLPRSTLIPTPTPSEVQVTAPGPSRAPPVGRPGTLAGASRLEKSRHSVSRRAALGVGGLYEINCMIERHPVNWQLYRRQPGRLFTPPLLSRIR